MRTALKIPLIGCGTLLMLFVMGLAWLSWELRPNPPASALPQLVRDFHGGPVIELQKAFHARVRSKFPDGIVADALAAELQREGFTLSHYHPLADQSGARLSFAFVEQHGDMCLSNWSVWWRRDDQGRARDIDGRFGYDCP